jgi:imidazolonepropionase-like amidohydrolase
VDWADGSRPFCDWKRLGSAQAMNRFISQQLANAFAPVWVACIAMAVLLSCPSAVAAPTLKPERPPVTAFTHVCVLPMDTNRVLNDQTVLVQGGEITAIGAIVSVPADARVIDGHGSACLSPGLADMHIHNILAAATRTPGEPIRRSLPASQTFGTIAKGSRADLVLSASNPLDDLSTLRKPLGVMANGKWYSREDLQAFLAQVAKLYRDASTLSGP